jgi:hypothetical protein
MLEFLNRPIENYKEMEVIFGNGLATGKFAMGSNEPLSNPFDFKVVWGCTKDPGGPYSCY